jgi:hypothetical protein
MILQAENLHHCMQKEEPMSGVAAEFYRGPHDGLGLNLDEIRRFCHLVRVEGGDEERLFAMMPTLGDWHRVLRGDLDRNGPFDRLYPYELKRRGDGAAFLFRRHDEFVAAVEDN